MNDSLILLAGSLKSLFRVVSINLQFVVYCGLSVSFAVLVKQLLVAEIFSVSKERATPLSFSHGVPSHDIAGFSFPSGTQV